MGWPAERTGLFIGADCKALWGQPLVDLAHKWHGSQPIDASMRSKAQSYKIEDASLLSFVEANSQYGKCDLTRPIGQLDVNCLSACCAMSHQLVMLHAFHYGNIPTSEHILILEEDVAFAPAAFAANTERLLRSLAQRPKHEWHTLKLGECETFTDDERAIVSAKDRCETPTNHKLNQVPYQQVTPFSLYNTGVGDVDETFDPRMKRSYCSHAYMIHGSQALHLVGTHYPIRANCDDQILDACDSKSSANCLRMEKYIFNQDPSSASSLGSSCHPCSTGEAQFNASDINTVKLESFSEPRPTITPLLTGGIQIPNGLELEAKDVDKWRGRHSRFEMESGGGGLEVVSDHDVEDVKKLNAATWNPQAVNNMCGQYAALNAGKELPNLQCNHQATNAECADACRRHKWCSSYIYHPILPAGTDVDTYSSSEYFLCQQDPYTDLSEKMIVQEWQGKCCLRFDDKFTPFIPPLWFWYDKDQPHVTSGTTMGNQPLDEKEDKVVMQGGLRLHMTDDIPDYLAAAPHDVMDRYPNSPAAIRHMNTVEYRQYGTVWAVARKQCQRKGLDLCPPTSYCKNGKQTRMIKAMVSGVPPNWYAPDQTASPDTDKTSMWMPTLRSCNSWINLHTCEEPDGANPENAPYMPALRWRNVQIGCCAPTEEATDTIDPQGAKEDHERRAFLARPNNRNFILNTLDDDAVRGQMTKRGKPAVLRIVVNHATCGLFASFQWVMIAMRFAKAAGLRAYVDHGPCTLSGYAPFTQDYSYHDWTAGPNSWSYFWEPVDTLNDLMAQPANHSVDILTLHTHQIWKIYGELPRFDVQSFQKGDFSGANGPVYFDAQWWAHHRGRAWQLVGSADSKKPIRFSKSFAAYEARKWAALLAQSAHNGTALAAKGERPRLIAAHMRGTDKQCSIGGPKIPAAEHFPLIDAFLANHPGSLVFVATDAPSTAKLMRERYGNRLLLENAVRSEKNALHEHGFHGEGYAFGKGVGAMLDSAHLSRADFLLCANSALGESAVWLNPKLADNMYNMQFPLKEQAQTHHLDVFGHGHNEFNLRALVNSYTPGFCVTKPVEAA